MKKLPTEKPKSEDVQKIVGEIPQRIIDELKNYKSVLNKGRGNKKLNLAQQLEMMELIARFTIKSEIVEYFMRTYQILVSPGLIQQYEKTPKWKLVIQELRGKYLSGTDQVALSHKRVRMERRDDLYYKALKTNQLRTAAIVIRDAEVEMGGGPGKAPSFNITLNQYNELSDKELEEKRQELLEKIKNKNVLEIKKES